MGGLPFFADGDFVPIRYVIGHKLLWLRSYEKQVEVLFTAVERLELDTRFTGGLAIAPVSSHGDLDDSSAIPLLLLTLTGGTFGSGFVACSKVSAVRIGAEGDESGEREVLFWEGASYSEHAVGGEAAEPGQVAFGLPVVRQFSREKRTTARFPPPGEQYARRGGGESKPP
ncbi:hypothetical protein [Amycolatopsis circi]|uniref:hypothetical protein n=1 Tax=Amycolatopsis circi TaxID=871959 RepID=UPI000E27FB51|nr:hypothetical protein [Amycolatopsis circi]